MKQGTTSKVNCILFDRLLSPGLLNKSGLARAKAVNFNLKILNKCFSNYYQVRTWPVFAETVTYYKSSESSDNLKSERPIDLRNDIQYQGSPGNFILGMGELMSRYIMTEIITIIDIITV